MFLSPHRSALARLVIAGSLCAQLVYGAALKGQQQPTGTPARQQPETIESLRARILEHISQPRFAAALWGVKIVSLDSGKTIVEHNPQKFFNPASNAKLYTAALALDRLGPDYRIKTSVYATARPDASGTLKGDLIVYGRGDPTMAARLNAGDYFKGIEPLINQIINSGIKKIDGDLVGDESYFAGPPFGAGWEWDDLQAYYGAEVSALTIDDNSLDVFVKPAERVGMPCKITTGPATSFVTIMNRTQTSPKGSDTRVTVYRPVGENIIYISGRVAVDNIGGFYSAISVHNPALLFVNILKNALASRGILVSGRTRIIDWKYREVSPLDLSRMIDLGSVDSMPIGDIVRETLKPSQNLWAQLLLLQVGEFGRTSQQSTGSPNHGSHAGDKSPGGSSTQNSTSARDETSEELGIDAMNEFLDRAGIRKGDVLLEEGSGLSRRDVITPEATVALLAYASRTRWFDTYRNALPIAGVDGTLQNRMKGTPAAGNVKAKTGSLRYVYTLSGYVTTAAGEKLAFSIMLNNYNRERPAPAKDTTTQAPAQRSSRDDMDAIPIMLAGFTGRSQ